MPEKKFLDKPQFDEVAQSERKFSKAVFDLGLSLIEDFKAGKCRDSNKILAAIIELFKVSRAADDKGANFADGR